MKKPFSFLSNLALVSQIGIMMVTPIVFSIWLGGIIDRRLSTGAWFLAIFTVLGVGSSFRNLFLLINKLEKAKRKEDDKDV